MRAREFNLLERRLQYTSSTSIGGYITNIQGIFDEIDALVDAKDDAIGQAEHDEKMVMPIMVTQAAGGKQATFVDFQPDKGQTAKLQQEWEKIIKKVEKLPEPQNEAEKKAHAKMLSEIWKYVVTGTVDDEKVSYPLGHFDKTARIKGKDRKSYNTGNMTEGIFASAIFLRLRKAADITKNELMSFMVDQLKAGQEWPPQDRHAKTTWTSSKIKNPVQDNLRIKVLLAPNNFAPLKDRNVMIGLNRHLTAIKDYVNTVEINRIQQEFLNNNIVDSITVRAAGTEDESTSKVDIDIVYTNETMKGVGDIDVDGNVETPMKVTYSRSLKTEKVDQFGQEATGGPAYDSPSYDLYGEDDVDKDGKSLKGKRKKGLDGEKQKTDMDSIIYRRWNRQHVFWKTFGIDIDTGKTQQAFKDNWAGNWHQSKKDDPEWVYDGFDFIDSFKTSYRAAVKQFNKALQGNDVTAVKTFFEALKYHARRNDPQALVTNFDSKKGTYEELDFNNLDTFTDTADLSAQYSKNLNTGEETTRAGVQIIANSPGKFKRTNHDGTTEIIEWSKGDIFMKFRLFVGEDKISNLIEKGPLIREWTKVAEG